MTATLEKRLLRHVLRADTGCWLWTGAISQRGYGQVGIEGKTRSAHRVAHEVFIGPIADGHQVDHTCHNADPTCKGGTDCMHRRCINPAHLEAVTSSVNQTRRFRDRCPNGHEYTDENTVHRADNGRRICVICRNAQSQRANVGYGKPGRPSKAAREALLRSRLRDTG